MSEPRVTLAGGSICLRLPSLCPFFIRISAYKGECRSVAVQIMLIKLRHQVVSDLDYVYLV